MKEQYNYRRVKLLTVWRYIDIVTLLPSATTIPIVYITVSDHFRYNRLPYSLNMSELFKIVLFTFIWQSHGNKRKWKSFSNVDSVHCFRIAQTFKNFLLTMFRTESKVLLSSVILFLFTDRVLCESSTVCGKICSCRPIRESIGDIIVQCRLPNVLHDIPDLGDIKKMLRVKEL